MNADKVRKELESELGVLRDRTVRIRRRKSNETREDVGNWDENAQQHQDDEVLDEIDERARDRIAAIERALDRLSAGTWSRCAGCGVRIDRARLAALPTTDRCARCAAKPGA
jgi:RNA polymerase-binding transcription factor DksA